jgi:hypothetical protein
VPICVVWIVHRIDALWIRRIFDIKQDSVSGACAGGEPEVWVHRDVVALIGVLCFRFFAVRAAATQRVENPGP